MELSSFWFCLNKHSLLGKCLFLFVSFVIIWLNFPSHSFFKFLFYSILFSSFFYFYYFYSFHFSLSLTSSSRHIPSLFVSFLPPPLFLYIHLSFLYFISLYLRIFFNYFFQFFVMLLTDSFFSCSTFLF